jgi:hypothetical protein
MNLPDEGNLTDYICPSFLPVLLPAPYQSFQSLLFPVNSRSNTILLANCYTMLMYGNDLQEIFSLYDSRITYSFDDLNTFQNPVNLLSIASSVLASPVTGAMLNYGINNSKYVGMFQSSPIQLQQLAGLIADFSYKLA